MTRTVYKYPVPLGRATMMLSPGARFLHIAEQYGQPMMWWLVDVDAPATEPVTLHVFGTGHLAPDEIDGWAHLGTWLMEGGSLVFHLFREPT